MNIMDASALLALLLNEQGADSAVSAIEEGAQISAVTLSEVIERLVLNGVPDAVVRQIAAELPLTVIPADAELAVDARLMAAITKPFGLSLGDRFCLALARQLGAQAVTADRAWVEASRKTGIEIRLIR
jgi:ribonuclease VapC